MAIDKMVEQFESEHAQSIQNNVILPYNRNQDKENNNYHQHQEVA